MQVLHTPSNFSKKFLGVCWLLGAAPAARSHSCRFPDVCLGLRSHMKPKWPGDWPSLGLGRRPKIMGGGKLCTLPLTFQESSLECAGSKGLPQLLEVIPWDSSGPGRGQDGAMLGASWPMLGLVWTHVGPGWTQGGSCWPKLRPC